MNSKESKWNHPFASLKEYNFRLYWIGMCVSLIGTWMQNIAQPWLAYSLTQSPLLLSLVGVLQFTPVLLFSLFAGVFIDRFPKKKIILITQSASLLVTLILGILVWSGHIRYWQILVMAGLMGVVNTFDMPARQSFVIQLAGKENLMNAIALNSMAFNVARIIGPSIAGIIMGMLGIAACFFINAVSFGTVIISILLIHVKEEKIRTTGHIRMWSEIRDGLEYIFHKKILLSTILAIAVVGTFVPNFSVLVPVFTKEILHLNETYFGIIMSCMGVGSFFGAMSIATMSKAGPKKFNIFVTPFIVVFFLALTGLTSHFVVTGIMLAFTGFFFLQFANSANTMIQLQSKEEYRGRVMSVYTLVFSGTTPIGNLYTGFFSEKFSARMGFLACAGAVVVLMIPLVLIFHVRKWNSTNKMA
jgi:predicted MFS family arabinose efflux permease